MKNRIVAFVLILVVLFPSSLFAQQIGTVDGDPVYLMGAYDYPWVSDWDDAVLGECRERSVGIFPGFGFGGTDIGIYPGEFFFATSPNVRLVDGTNALGYGGDLYVQMLDRYTLYRAAIAPPAGAVAGEQPAILSFASMNAETTTLVVCTPNILPPTVTPTLEVLPAACFRIVGPPTGTFTYEFPATQPQYELWYEGSSLVEWATNGPDADDPGWQSLPQYPGGSGAVVLGGYTELFRPSWDQTTPPTIIACGLQATPTPTGTVTPTPSDPQVGYCPENMQLTIADGEEFICEAYPDDVVAATCGTPSSGHWVQLHFRLASEIEWGGSPSGICSEQIITRGNGERVFFRWSGTRSNGTIEITTRHYSDIYREITVPFSESVAPLPWQRVYYEVPAYQTEFQAFCSQTFAGSPWSTFGTDDSRFSCVSGDKVEIFNNPPSSLFYLENFGKEGVHDIAFSLIAGSTATPAPVTRTPLPTVTSPPWVSTATATITPDPALSPTPTLTPTMTLTPGPSDLLSCVFREEYSFLPGTTFMTVTIAAGVQFQVINGPILFDVYADSYPIENGVYTWGFDSGAYGITKGTDDSRLIVCSPISQVQPSLVPTLGVLPGTPTATASCDPCTKLDEIISNQQTQIALMDRTALPATATATSTVTGTIGVTPTQTGTPTVSPTPLPLDVVGIGFTVALLTVDEGTSAVLVIQLTQVVTYPVSVDYQVVPETAGFNDLVRGAAFEGTTTIPAGLTQTDLVLETRDDGLIEDTERLAVVLSNPRLAVARGPGLQRPLPQFEEIALQIALDAITHLALDILDDETQPDGACDVITLARGVSDDIIAAGARRLWDTNGDLLVTALQDQVVTQLADADVPDIPLPDWTDDMKGYLLNDDQVATVENDGLEDAQLVSCPSSAVAPNQNTAVAVMLEHEPFAGIDVAVRSVRTATTKLDDAIPENPDRSMCIANALVVTHTGTIDNTGMSPAWDGGIDLFDGETLPSDIQTGMPAYICDMFVLANPVLQWLRLLAGLTIIVGLLWSGYRFLDRFMEMRYGRR